MKHRPVGSLPGELAIFLCGAAVWFDEIVAPVFVDAQEYVIFDIVPYLGTVAIESRRRGVVVSVASHRLPLLPEIGVKFSGVCCSRGRRIHKRCV